MSIVLFALFTVSMQTRDHFSQVGPLVETVNQLSKGVNESMLLVNDWLITANPNMKQDRQAIWDDVIYPSVDELRHQTGGELDGRGDLLVKLQELQIEQWIVEDLANQPGNEEASDIYQRRILETEKQVFALITRVIDLFSQPTSQTSEQILPLITYAANIRGYFSFSSANLAHCIEAGSRSSEENFWRNLETARNNLALLIQKSELLSATQCSLVGRLEKLMIQYRNEADRAITIRHSPRWNQAVYNYNNILVPLSREMTERLNLLLINKTAMLHSSSQHLIRFGYKLIFGCTLIGFLAAFLIVLRARRDIVVAGELEGTILQNTRQLEELSRIDQLTGLFNRRAMEEMLEREVGNARRNERPLSFAYFDVDRFKEINDNRGHVAGDEVLRHIGKSLRGSIREVDIPCRYGGDEFCIILPGCGHDDAKKVCEKLIRKFREAFPDISLSIGIAELDLTGSTNPEKLIKMADEKMYLAKEKTGCQIRI